MSDEADPTFLLTFELLHDLVRETEALHQTVEQVLLIDSVRKRRGPSRDPIQENSFYRDLEWRLSKGLISPVQTTHVLNLILREVNFFRIMIQNFYGAITRDQPLLLNRKRVSLEPLLQEVIELFMFSAAAKGVDIQVKVAGASVLFIDRDLVYRTFINVIENAIKYSYSGAESSKRYVLVESRRHSVQGDVMIAVTSYGVGITKEELSRDYIFQYGSRGILSADRGRRGSGIGLAEAKRIVEAHEGRIQITSREVTSEAYLTTVRIVLPGLRS